MAHTPENSDENALVAAVGDDQPDLLDTPLFGGPVRHVEETLKRAGGRGRPKGAANKRTTQMRDTLLKMGFRHPMMNLAALANADPHELAAELSEPYRPEKGPNAGQLVEASCTPGEAMAMILKANAELLPYFESKRPTEIDVTERRLGVFVVGELPARAEVDGVFSVTGVVSDIEEDQ